MNCKWNYSLFTRYLYIFFTLVSQASKHERALLKKLFHSTYDKNERPVVNDSDTVTVIFGLTLNQIVDVVRISYSFTVFCVVIPGPSLRPKRHKQGGL